MNPTVEYLLEAPTLPEAVAILKRHLEVERERRERFYDEITPDMKAEFINGEVFLHSADLHRHTAAQQRLTQLLQSHAMAHSLGAVFGEKILCVFPRNDYQPDVIFYGSAKAAGLDSGRRKLPPPDFICEVLSDSTLKRDRGVKYKDYEAHGVQEYWLVDPASEVLEQYVLNASKRYDLRLKSGSGDVVSAIIPGFAITIRALFDGPTNLAHIG